MCFNRNVLFSLSFLSSFASTEYAREVKIGAGRHMTSHRRKWNTSSRTSRHTIRAGNVIFGSSWEYNFTRCAYSAPDFFAAFLMPASPAHSTSFPPKSSSNRKWCVTWTLTKTYECFFTLIWYDLRAWLGLGRLTRPWTRSDYHDSNEPCHRQ